MGGMVDWGGRSVVNLKMLNERLTRAIARYG